MSGSAVWAEAVVLGTVQGLTEFLPVSSSAHLRIVGPMLPSGGDPGAAFTAITQIGTEAAVLLYFRHDILRIGSAWLKSLHPRTARAQLLSADARMGAVRVLPGRARAAGAGTAARRRPVGALTFAPHCCATVTEPSRWKSLSCSH